MPQRIVPARNKGKDAANRSERANIPKMRIIARNKKALHDYQVLEKVEAGIELKGSEVKSIRTGNINLADSFAQCHGGEIYVKNVHIGPVALAASPFAPDPLRPRRLLLHHRQIVHLCSEVARKKLTLIPLSVYFLQHLVKVELGLCRGRKKYDKREALAAADAKKRIAAIMKRMR